MKKYIQYLQRSGGIGMLNLENYSHFTSWAKSNGDVGFIHLLDGKVIEITNCEIFMTRLQDAIKDTIS